MDVKETQNSDSFVIFPNPANDKITIIVPQIEENYNVSLLDVLGYEIMQYNAQNINKNRIDLNLPSQLTTGTYFIRIKTNRNIYQNKIVVLK